MEIRQSVNRVPTRPIVFVLAALAVLALALTAWYALQGNAPSRNQGIYKPAVTACTSMAPDAEERCAETIAAQQSKAETTHGH